MGVDRGGGGGGGGEVRGIYPPIFEVGVACIITLPLIFQG